MVELTTAANIPQDNRTNEPEDASLAYKAQPKQTTQVRPDGTVVLQGASVAQGTAATATRSSSDVAAAQSVDTAGATEADLASQNGRSLLAVAEGASVPSLPDVAGKSASPVQTQAALSGYVPAQNTDISGAAIYNILQRAANAQQELAATIRRGAQSAAVAAKQLSVDLLKSQISAEQKSAGFKFAFSVAGAVVTGGSAFAGSKLKSSLDPGDKPSYGSMLEASAQGLGGMVTGGADFVNKVSGYEYQADMDRIAGKVADISAQIAQNNVDTAKSGWDAAAENLRNVQTLLNNYMQNWTQVTNNTANR